MAAMEQKKIAIVSRIYSPEPAAASFRLSALAATLEKAGNAVQILTVRPPQELVKKSASPNKQSEETEQNKTNIQISRFPVLRDKEGYVKGYLQYLSFDIPAFFRVLFSRADVFIVEPPPTTGFFVRIASALRRKPYIYYAADIWSDATEAMDTPGIITRILRSVESFALRGAKRVIAVSPGVAERVVALGGNPTVVRNGIDTEIFSPTGPLPRPEKLQKLGISSNYAVYAGTMSPWQGADIFIRALSQSPLCDTDLDLVFMGRGDDLPHLQKLAQEIAPGRVHFLDSQPPEISAQWQRGAIAGLVSIAPECGYDFAYPTKFLASLSCGTPVCYAGAGPAGAEIRQFQLGEICTWDIQEVAEKLAKLLDERAAQSPEAAKTHTQKLHGWIQAHRSTAASAAAAAKVVAEALAATPR